MNLAEQLDELMRYTLASAGEVDADVASSTGEVVATQGLVRKWAFHVSRVKEVRSRVIDLASRIVTDEFLKGKGGGMSFLHLNTDRAGNAWAEHSRMEAFLCLSIACRIAGYCAPREIWPAFPGAMPYVWFDFPQADARP